MKLPSSVTTVLFDMDGVLIDSSLAVHAGYTQWAEESGHDVDEVLAFVHGRRTIEVVNEFGSSDDPEAEAERVEGTIASRALPEHQVRAGCELYRSLNRDRVAVATSAMRSTAFSNLEVLDLPEPRVLVSGDDVKSGKPAPDPYLLAAAQLGAEPENCAVIEDAPAGVKAGKAAGCFVVAVTTTHEPDELGEADMVVGPEELERVFAGLVEQGASE
ncbi:MAG: HAD-IA family hydrolase [Solirubrobacterales bacterium]|nr:HAD-IA family hydrolase [Solirubrobacterales bacterium]